MTWNEYKDWLETNIIETKTILDEDRIVLRAGIAEKYSLGNLIGQEFALAKAIGNLVLSIENNNDYISSESDSEYYTLPALTDLMNDNKQVKSWAELFPDHTTTFFGKKDNDTVLGTKTWTALEQIFADWQSEETRVQELEKQLNEDEIAKEFLIRTSIHFNYDLLKRGGYEAKLTNWLTEYNKLGQEKQEELKEKKDQAKKLLAYLREEFKLHEEKKNESWYQNIPWTSVIWYGCGILLVILVLGWLRSKLKK